jgi:heat shock protein HslJ
VSNGSPRRIALVGVGAFAVVILVIGGVLLALRGSTTEPAQSAKPAATSSTSPTTATSPATTTTTLETTTASGSTADGFTAVDTALTEARDQWSNSNLQSYGYLLTVECDCPDATTAWVRRFAEWDDRETPIEDLFDQLAAALSGQPDSISVSFSKADGHPVSFEIVGGTDTRSVTINHFHAIVAEPSPYDGAWRLVSGVLDGAQFTTETTGGYQIALDRGRIAFPIDCNDAQGPVDITGEWFGIGPYITTAVGCGEASETSKSFNEALLLSETIRLDGDELVLSSARSELRFVVPETPAVVADLPLTSAGATLTLDDAPEGYTNRSQYVIISSVDRFGSAPWYVLAAATNDDPATDTVTVVLPDDIPNGDFYLCSPFWEPDPYCYTLPVRPPSASWYVTAGLNGIVLHDANGTSKTLLDEPTAIAFYVDDRLVFQTLDAMDRIQIDGAEPVALAAGEHLADVAAVDGGIRALVVGSGGSTVIELDTGERLPVGPASSRGLIVGGSVVLRTAPDHISAYDISAGTMLWERAVKADTLVTTDSASLRLDTMRDLQYDAGSDPYFQYVDTEIVESASGETIDSYEWEVAIPEDGDNINEQCGRSDFDGDYLICPQPDGRIVTLEVAGGESHTFATGAIVATFARSGE